METILYIGIRHNDELLERLAQIPVPVLFSDKDTVTLLSKIRAHLDDSKKLEERKKARV